MNYGGIIPNPFLIWGFWRVTVFQQLMILLRWLGKFLWAYRANYSIYLTCPGYFWQKLIISG
jgi:hypothetical protein